MVVTNPFIDYLVKFLNKECDAYYNKITNWQALIIEYNRCLDITPQQSFKLTEKNKTLPQSLGIDYKIPPYEELKK